MSGTAERLRDLQGDYRLAICLEAADELDRLTALNAEMLAALKALFENTDDGDCTATDLFYDYGVKGGAHWCKVCAASADDYVRVTHDSDCIVGCAEDAIARAEGKDDAR